MGYYRRYSRTDFGSGTDDDDDVSVLDASSVEVLDASSDEDDATSDTSDTSDDGATPLEQLALDACPYTATYQPPTPPRAAPGGSMFQGENKLPDEVVMMILRRADYNLNMLRVCKDLRRLGTKDFADYWLGRIIHAEETRLNDAETAPETSKKSKRWRRGVSVKVETDGRSGAKRRVMATEFFLQRRLTSAAKRLNVHRILEIVMHGAATGHRGELCQAILRACDEPANKLHASMLTRFSYITDVAYDRQAYIPDGMDNEEAAELVMNRALLAPIEADRIASRRAVQENYLQHVGCTVAELPLEYWMSHGDESTMRRKYGMSRADAVAKMGEIVEAAKLVVARLRPHVRTAVMAETIGGARVFTTPEEVEACVRNAGLNKWHDVFWRTPRPSRRDCLRMMLARYMDPNTRPWVVRMVGPVSFWHTSGLKYASNLFNPESYAANYTLDTNIRDYYSEVRPCGGRRYFRTELAAGNYDPNEVARHNLGRYSADLYWDTSLLESLVGTFANGTFAGRIGHWNVSRVNTMDRMLRNNVALDPRTLLEWNVQSVTTGDKPQQLVRERGL